MMVGPAISSGAPTRLAISGFTFSGIDADGSGDILEGNVLDLILHHAIELAVGIGRQLGLEKARDDRVDADLEGREGGRQELGHLGYVISFTCLDRRV